MKQLTPVEKYALQLIEYRSKDWREGQLAAADAEIEAQKQEFDARKLEEMTEALGTASSTPTETGSLASEDTGSSTDTDNEASDSDDDSSSDEDNTVTDNDAEETASEDNDQDNADQNESNVHDETLDENVEINMGNPLSPRTRSRVDVRINLWNLDK